MHRLAYQNSNRYGSIGNQDEPAVDKVVVRRPSHTKQCSIDKYKPARQLLRPDLQEITAKPLSSVVLAEDRRASCRGHGQPGAEGVETKHDNKTVNSSTTTRHCHSCLSVSKDQEGKLHYDAQHSQACCHAVCSMVIGLLQDIDHEQRRYPQQPL